VADRGDPLAWCPEWHGDGTVSEHDGGSDVVVMAPTRAMGEARQGRHRLRWQGSYRSRDSVGCGKLRKPERGDASANTFVPLRTLSFFNGRWPLT
jgi:hypothetical protein